MTSEDEICSSCHGSGISYTSLGDGCHFRDYDCPHCLGTGRGPCKRKVCGIHGKPINHKETMTNISGETTTTSYTPGPYIADRCTTSAFAICSDANVENSDIAMVYHKHPDNDHDAFYSDEAEALANAILLAAAPDLHRALHALRHGRLPNSDEALMPSDIQALVDAALAKAVAT